ncbi:exocyst complex component Sec6-domain-containing protein [Suillus variegatus]|nr:exocyst complex component Sec6-domain-containing protein [Suillus variegatus]
MAAPPRQVSAAQAIGEYLQSPDDLLKISAFRKKLEKEKASIEEQLDATREGLTKLLGTRNNVQVIKEEDADCGQDALRPSKCCRPSTISSGQLEVVQASMVYRNFEQTEEMVNNLLEMNSKLDVLEELLEVESRTIIGPAPNLLPIHFHVNRLEAFRNQTMHQAKKASANSRQKPAPRNALPLVRAGYQQAVVKLIKIVELEAQEDEQVWCKAIAIRLVKKAAKMDAASRFKSMQANTCIIEHYRSKVTKAILDSIKANFDDAYTRHQRDPGAFLGGLSWIYQDLIRIESDVVQCFPPSYKMHAFHIKEYHRTLNATLQRIIESEPDASIMFDLHARIKEYRKNMTELNVAPELLDPPLLGGEEQNLIEDYLKLIVKKLDEWSANLMKTDSGVHHALGSTSGGQRRTLWHARRGYPVPDATESGQGAMIARVVGEVNRVMRNVQDQWTKVVEAELKKQMEKPEEVVGGLAEYCIALANDQIKFADNTEALLGRLEPLVSEKYRTPIATERIKEDINTVLSFSGFKPTKELEPYFEVVDLILAMLEASKSIAFRFGPSRKYTGHVCRSWKD